MGRSYHVNCMGGAIDLPSQQFKEAAVVVSSPGSLGRGKRAWYTINL